MFFVFFFECIKNEVMKTKKEKWEGDEWSLFGIFLGDRYFFLILFNFLLYSGFFQLFQSLSLGRFVSQKSKEQGRYCTKDVVRVVSDRLQVLVCSIAKRELAVFVVFG